MSRGREKSGLSPGVGIGIQYYTGALISILLSRMRKQSPKILGASQSSQEDCVRISKDVTRLHESAEPERDEPNRGTPLSTPCVLEE